MIEKNSLMIRILSSFVMLTIFIVMVYSNNLAFLIFSQLILFLTSWEILRMLEFKSFIKKRVDRSNFLLTRCQIKKMSQSSEFISFILFIVFFTMIVDVSAYFFGSIIGGRRIMPNISPNKTVAGCIGGIIVPIFFCVIIFFKNSNISNIILLTLLLSIISQLGDLIESGFKRYCCVKDSSNIIPGHGGLLDRLDSIFALIIFVSIFKLLDYNFFFIV